MGVLQTLRLGPNGELLLPSALRESLRLEPGDLVQVGVETPGRSSGVLKLEVRRAGSENLAARQAAFSDTDAVSEKHGSVDDLIGCVGYHGPLISVEDMDAAVGRAIAEQWRNG